MHKKYKKKRSIKPMPKTAKSERKRLARVAKALKDGTGEKQFRLRSKESRIRI